MIIDDPTPCAARPELWDLHLDRTDSNLEPLADRQRRHLKAAAHCRLCTHRDPCAQAAAATKADGVRGGVLWQNGEPAGRTA